MVYVGYVGHRYGLRTYTLSIPYTFLAICEGNRWPMKVEIVIFNSYAKLPEGMVYFVVTTIKIET